MFITIAPAQQAPPSRLSLSSGPRQHRLRARISSVVVHLCSRAHREFWNRQGLALCVVYLYLNLQQRLWLADRIIKG